MSWTKTGENRFTWRRLTFTLDLFLDESTWCACVPTPYRPGDMVARSIVGREAAMDALRVQFAVSSYGREAVAQALAEWPAFEASLRAPAATLWRQDGDRFVWQRGTAYLYLTPPKTPRDEWVAILYSPSSTYRQGKDPDSAMDAICIAVAGDKRDWQYASDAKREWPAFAATVQTAATEPEAPAVDPKLDTNKPDIAPLLTIPIEVLAECARVRAFGVAKYGPENWRNVARGRWMAAALRHLACEVQSPGSRDPETGERHLAHVVVSVLLAMGVEV